MVCIEYLHPIELYSSLETHGFLSLFYLVRIVRVYNPGQAEVSNLKQQLVCVDEYVGRFQISVQDVSRVDELQPS